MYVQNWKDPVGRNGGASRCRHGKGPMGTLVFYLDESRSMGSSEGNQTGSAGDSPVFLTDQGLL
jgi:hypothetical protein